MNGCFQRASVLELRPLLLNLSSLPFGIFTGGKSSVICDPSGTKVCISLPCCKTSSSPSSALQVVFGHPKLMPLFAALVPQFTVGMPGSNTDFYFKLSLLSPPLSLPPSPSSLSRALAQVALQLPQGLTHCSIRSKLTLCRQVVTFLSSFLTPFLSVVLSLLCTLACCGACVCIRAKAE